MGEGVREWDSVGSCEGEGGLEVLWVRVWEPLGEGTWVRVCVTEGVCV